MTLEKQIPLSKVASPMERLLAIMAALRDPVAGCPWDVEQTFETIAPYTLEEAYEVHDAITRGNLNDLREELGDLLLQVVFHAQMAAEQKEFTFDDVVTSLCDKLIYRHPHVFGDVKVNNAAEVIGVWDARKKEEKKSGLQDSAIDGVTQGLPALMRAQKLQKKAAKAGFVWPDLNACWDKVEEELQEVKTEIKNGPKSEKAAEELGDLIFCLVNYARMAGHDAESMLTRTNTKFETRFRLMEKILIQENKDMPSVPLQEMLTAWSKTKESK
jgi:nucleoside triphosphate diphosphatase